MPYLSYIIKINGDLYYFLLLFFMVFRIIFRLIGPCSIFSQILSLLLLEKVLKILTTVIFGIWYYKF